MEKDLLEDDLFAFYLSYNPDYSSELTLGYYDESRFETGTLNWHDVVNPVFFSIELVDVRYGDVSLNICGTNSYQ
jgi:hypothetical protein